MEKDPDFNKKYERLAFICRIIITAKITPKLDLNQNSEENFLEEKFNGEYYLSWWVSNNKCNDVIDTPRPQTETNVESNSVKNNLNTFKNKVKSVFKNILQYDITKYNSVEVKPGSDITTLFDNDDEMLIFFKTCKVFLRSNLENYYRKMYYCTQSLYGNESNLRNKSKLLYLIKDLKLYDNSHIQEIIVKINTLHKLISDEQNYYNINISDEENYKNFKKIYDDTIYRISHSQIINTFIKYPNIEKLINGEIVNPNDINTWGGKRM